jgi:hypothetical protein
MALAHSAARLKLGEGGPPWQQEAMSGPGALILSILMIAAFLLAGGGAYLVLKKKDRHKGSLMLLAALVFLINVLIWTL